MTKKCYFLPELDRSLFRLPEELSNGFYFCTCNQTTVVFHFVCIITFDELVINFNDETYHCAPSNVPLLTGWFNGGMNI